MELILGIIAIILSVLLILFFVLLIKTKKELNFTKDKLTVAEIIINENESDNDNNYLDEKEVVDLKQIDLNNAEDVERLAALEKMLKVVTTKQTIDLKEVDLSKVDISNDPITLEKFVHLINEHIDREKYKEIKTYALTNWLYKNGLIAKFKVPVTKYVYKYDATDLGIEMGIISGEVDENGVVNNSYMLGEIAQHFILDNLDSFIKGECVVDTKKVREAKGLKNIGRRWTEEEDDRLVEEYQSGNYKMTELAKMHQRTRGAIVARLKKLGIID